MQRACARDKQKRKAGAFEKEKARFREYNKARRKKDPAFVLADLIRSRVGKVLRGGKSRGSLELLGCSYDELVIHIENQFQPGMTWENRGKTGWHVDHKRPLVSFDLGDDLQLREACHFSNLQPLWARDNLSKGGKYSCGDKLT